MSLKLKDIVGNIFFTDKKAEAEAENKSAEMQQKTDNVFGRTEQKKINTFNPFLNKDGQLINPYVDYQKLLDNPSISSNAKKYIQDATGLEPTVKPTDNKLNYEQQRIKIESPKFDSTVPKTEGYDPNTQNSPTGEAPKGTGAFVNLVGQRITDTSKYKNGAKEGQCVWYVLGRASEVNGKNIVIYGDGNGMYQNAKAEAKLSAKPENLRGNMLLSYKKGTSSLGQKYGHVIFIEDVVGDTVYYTEGGSGYYKTKTDGVVKTATREQILNGVNSSGARIGSEPIGLIDLSKY